MKAFHCALAGWSRAEKQGVFGVSMPFVSRRRIESGAAMQDWIAFSSPLLLLLLLDLFYRCIGF